MYTDLVPELKLGIPVKSNQGLNLMPVSRAADTSGGTKGGAGGKLRGARFIGLVGAPPL